MKGPLLRRAAEWGPSLVIALLIVLAGARQIVLGAHERATSLRSAARSAATHQASLIAAELEALLELARRDARRQAITAHEGARPAPAFSQRHVFLMSGAGTVLSAPESDRVIADALAREWAATAATGAEALFGPVRYGSQWFIAAQTPLESPGVGRVVAGGVRSVAYEGIDSLLLTAHFGLLGKAGYDFQLSQPAARSAPARLFLSSRSEALPDAVTLAIPAPGKAAPGAAYLALAVRPRGGWNPVPELLAEIGLVVMFAWALAFGSHDLRHSLTRTRNVLARTRARLHSVNQQLSAAIEQRQALQKSLEHARYHDPSTGLPNRRYLMDQLDRALRELRSRQRERIAVMLIDIDRFALINDTLGHTAGDDLMLQAAQRFEKALAGSECVLARWSGDQIAMLVLQAESAAAVQAIAAAIHATHHKPFVLRQHRIKVVMRIGLTCLDSGLLRAEDALREADIALAVAKRQQRAFTAEYTPGMGGAAVSLVSLEADLHIALARNEFRLLFQPVVDLRRWCVVGVEALLRWRHPVEGLLAPAAFLAIAEEAAVMVPVTRWVIERVCRLAAEWRQRLPPGVPFYFSVNLSAAALRDPGLGAHVAQVLQETGVAPQALKFELTESSLIGNVSGAREVLGALRAMGIELMLDDFGTGYSSLNYLQLFPFDYVKIDRPFARRTGSEPANNAITAAILQVAAGLGLRAIGEVVETPAAAQALLQMGCDFAQGFYFAPPLEAEEALLQLGSPARLPRPEAPAAAAADESAAADPAATLVLADSPTLVLPAAQDAESRKDEDGAGFDAQSSRGVG
jgi:diguanylate cyclase (GGDEF)-like protein